MSKQHIYENLKVGDLVYLDPSKVRTSWGKRWANNKWAITVVDVPSGKIYDDSTIGGICDADTHEGRRVFDASRILAFVDTLSQIKRESQRL